MTDQELLALKPMPAPGTFCRAEAFGAMVAGGNLPIMNLNEDGMQIWELCDGIKTVAEIESLLLKDFQSEGLRERLFIFLQYCLENNFMINTEKC
jgi:hypothetical protein